MFESKSERCLQLRCSGKSNHIFIDFSMSSTNKDPVHFELTFSPCSIRGQDSDSQTLLHTTLSQYIDQCCLTFQLQLSLITSSFY